VEHIKVEVPPDLHGKEIRLFFTFWNPLLVLQKHLLLMSWSDVERRSNAEQPGTGAQRVFSTLNAGLAMEAAERVRNRAGAVWIKPLGVYSDGFAMSDRKTGWPMYLQDLDGDNTPLVVGLLPDLKKKGLTSTAILEIFHFCMGLILKELRTASAGVTLYARFGTSALDATLCIVSAPTSLTRAQHWAGSNIEGRRCVPLLLTGLCDKVEGKCYMCQANWFSPHPCFCCSVAQGHMSHIEREASESMPKTEADLGLLLGEASKAELDLKVKMAELKSAKEANPKRAGTVRQLAADVRALRDEKRNALDILKWVSLKPVESSFAKFAPHLELYSFVPPELLHDAELGLVIKTLELTGAYAAGVKGRLNDINKRWKREMSQYSALRRVSRMTLYDLHKKSGVVGTAITFRAFELRVVLQVFPYMIFDMEDVVAVWFALWDWYVAAHATEFTDATITDLEEKLSK
jgi:hypothetical protein